MKKTVAVITLAAVAVAGVQTASAGNREWATVGKVLTGIAAVHVLAKALDPGPCHHTTTYVTPSPVVVQQPFPVVVQQVYPRVVVQPAPVVVQQVPVVVYAAPMYVPAPRVYVAPRPLVSFHLGIGHRHPHHYHR